MPKLKITDIQKHIDVFVGEKLIDILEGEAVPVKFKCRVGTCGACSLTITEGHENLSSKTQTENQYFAKYPSKKFARLACQCRIHGDVEILVTQNEL